MSELTISTQNYLKSIFLLEELGEKVSTTSLAGMLKVAPASVTGMLKKLNRDDLIEYQPYQLIHLSESGRVAALQVIRRHRLLELFLTETVGMSWHEVHEEAERLEHVISASFLDHIDRLLNFPRADPHGSPIPDRTLILPERHCQPLSKHQPGEVLQLTEVMDEDAGFLVYLAQLGLRPGQKFNLVEIEPYEGSFILQTDTGQIRLSLKAAGLLFVERIQEN